MKKSYILLALAVLVATASCRKSDQEVPDRASQTLALTVVSSDFESSHAEADSVVAMLQRAFSADSQSPTPGTATRAGETAFEANDSIGLYVHTTSALGTTGIHTANICYATYDGAAWTAEGYLSDILKSGTTYYATAYYPFVRRIIEPTIVAHAVAADQSTKAALTASDLMYSAPTAISNPTTAPSIALSFKHLLSKVVATFTVPSLLDGAVVTGVDRVVVKSVDRAVNVNLADGSTASINNKGDIELCHTAGIIGVGEEVTYEGILPPQTIAKGARMIEIYFTTAAGEKNYKYALDTELKLTANMKHTFTLVSIGDLCFMSTLDLTDGLAHSYLPLKIKSLPGIEWTLSSKDEWLKFSTNTTDTPTASIKGTGDGAEQTVYVSVTANTAMVGQFWEPRAAVLTLEAKGAKSTYTARQNFYRFELETSTRQIGAAQSVIGVEGFGANQVWSAASGADWIKLASSVVYGEGSPSASYGPVNGSLASGTIFYQIEANNTDAVRTGTVVFTPTTVGGKGAAVTFEQAAGSVRVSTTKAMISGGAAAAIRMFDLTVSQGLKWKILSATGVTTSPAVGEEQTGLGTPIEIKGTWAANNTTEVINGEVVIGYGAYGAEQKRTVTITQAPEFIVVNGTRWATGNLVGNGVNGARIGAPTDGGLYFQYGGLIGYKGGDKGDGTGFPTVTSGKWWGNADAFSWSNEVAITPAGYTSPTDKWPYFENKATGGYGYYYYNNFVAKYADFQSQANGKDVALGVGDPCATYLGGAWRLPRYDELAAISGNSTEGSWVPWSDASIQGRWMRPSSTHPVNGAWFGPNSRTGTPTEKTDLFIPASGYRMHNTGVFWQVGIEGFLWSSSVCDYYLGFYLLINESSGVYPRRANNRAHGFPVRCVQDAPTEPQPPTANQVIEVNGLKWTKGNLVATGGHNAKVGAPGDGGLYFQYGSLIGYKGGANGDGTGVVNATTHADGKWWNGAAAYSAADVAVKPATYTNQATWPNFENVASGGFGYYYFNSFVTKYADFQPQPNANNPTLGIGDPCAYYLGSDWRLPTYVELSAITGSAVEGAWVPWATAGVTGRWEKTGPKSAIGAWFGPNSRTGTPTEKTDLFIPASGHRNAGNGAFYWVGIGGYLWSSSVCNASYGFSLQVNEPDGVCPRHPNYRAHGFPVRCVEGVSVGTNPADWTGVVAAGATLEVVVSVGGASGWTAQPSATAGFTATPTSGKSGDKITLTWTDNTAEGSPARSATVVFTAQGSAQTYTFNTTQAAAGPENAVNINGTWWQLSNAGSATWANAPALCPSPWRLPSKSDFENLINSGNMSQVTGISSGRYWSSTEYDVTSGAWGLSNGKLVNSYKGSNCIVRCCQ